MLSSPEQVNLASILDDDSASVYQRVIAGDSLRYALMKDEARAEAEKVAARVIELGTAFLSDAQDRAESMAVYDALERAYITRARNDFHSYLVALEWHRAARARFYQPRMGVLREVVDALTDMMVYDLYDIILFSMPVRVGKTTLGLLFLSWCIGRDPDSPILASGFAEKITKMFYAGLTEVYEDPEYNYHAIFPQLDLVNTSALDLTLDFRNDAKKVVRKYKSITCRAIGAALQGATEARQVLYCDDLVSGIEEALSPDRLMTLRDKMITDLYSRKKSGCKEVHIGTRWSIHDPMGWVEKTNEGNPRCKVFAVPALDYETDESNFDYPYNLGFNTEFYRERRRIEDDVTWNCVYQQRPIEREGLLFPAEALKYTTTKMTPEYLKDNPPDDVFAFVDVAFGGDDYLAVPIAYQWGDDSPVIADAVYLKGDYKITEPIVSGTLINHLVRRAIFEANNGGDFYSRDVTALINETGYRINIVAMRAPSNKSKETRIIQHSPAIKDFVFLDPHAKDAAGEFIASPMYRLFLSHLTAYTVSGKNLNDDAPDALAGLASMMRTNLNATIRVYTREHI